MASSNPNEQLEAWIAEARKLGETHARNAASWVTNGNESDDSRQHKLYLLGSGDGEDLDEWLPTRPNLSGEWADGLTPLSLAENVIGYSISERTEAAWLDVIDALCEAWEEGVSETFESECERVLRAALGEDES